jgi:hypothetical protein
MGQGRLFQPFCLRVLLLVALAIQGITPDSRDVASINALIVLCPGLSIIGQSVDEDEFPDDVCEPIAIGLALAALRSTDSDGLAFATSGVAEFQCGTVALRALPLLARNHANTCSNELIHALCRLTC